MSVSDVIHMDADENTLTMKGVTASANLPHIYTFKYSELIVMF